MKYLSFITLVSLLAPSHVLAVGADQSTTLGEIAESSVQPSGEQTEERTAADIAAEQDAAFGDFIVEQTELGPTSQEEANLLVDEYIFKNFRDVYYTETQSVGEIKLIIQDKYLFTNQDIDFSVVQYHIDRSFVFDGATYTWRVLRGDQEIFTLTDVDKTAFFYNFSEAGTYQVEVSVDSGVSTKTGTFDIEVFDKVAIDYRPLNPAAGDVISLSTEYSGADSIVNWTVDGESVATDRPELTFREFKGVGESYQVEVVIRDRASGLTQYYGATTIEIQAPDIRFTLFDETLGLPLDYQESLRIEDLKDIVISGEADNFNQEARLQYTYRVNGSVVEHEGNALRLSVDPNTSYKIDLVIDDLNSDQIVTKGFVINESKQDLAANLDQEADRMFLMSDRYWGLLIFGIIAVLGIVLSFFGKAKVS